MGKPDEKRIDWPEKRLDMRLNITAVACERAGIEEAIKLVLEEASRKFIAKKDAEAECLRQMSDVLQKRETFYRNELQKRNEEYDKLYGS